MCNVLPKCQTSLDLSSRQNIRWPALSVSLQHHHYHDVIILSIQHFIVSSYHRIAVSLYHHLLEGLCIGVYVQVFVCVIYSQNTVLLEIKFTNGRIICLTSFLPGKNYLLEVKLTDGKIIEQSKDNLLEVKFTDVDTYNLFDIHRNYQRKDNILDRV